ncbi:hypothetical protein niasHS_003593 [Heterodera schachtii]|uniref:Uncharacterized protein n=1 Tax=Heterodera schachtii TaxID=97005 RepID=A0ABD2KHE6_HETSC
MTSFTHHFTYLGFFQLNENLNKGSECLTDDLQRRTIEEQLIDSAEMAQLNSELIRANCEYSGFIDEIELRLISGALQFVHPNSPIPFERIPLHKIKHIISFENGRGAVNVLLVENFAYSSDHRLGLVSKCHLFETQRGDDGRGVAMVEEFCQGFKQKFGEILGKLSAEQQQKQ